MPSISKDLQRIFVDHSLLGALLCYCLSSVLVVVAQDVGCINECPFVNPTIPRLQLTLKPGINQAVCLDFEYYIPAGDNFIAFFNDSQCTAFSGFEENALDCISCKILANLDKNRTNCTVQAVVIECIMLGGFVNQVTAREDSSDSSSSDSPSSDSSSSNSQDDGYEEFGFALQVNSTNIALTSFVSDCNVYIDATWMRFRE